MRALIVPLALVAACAARPTTGPSRPAMTPRDDQGLSMSDDVVQRFEHMMRRGIREQIEPGACVASFKIDSTRGRPVVDIYALTLADVDSADALHIWYHGPQLCGDTLPSVHGHVLRERDLPNPSPPDWDTLQRFAAPFGLILYRFGSDSTFGVTLYWRHR